MIDLKPKISQIEKLLAENTEASVTYAALECRLAIERICYERLRLVHDYISHDDLRKWQPSDIVKRLIQQVDATAASTLTVSIAGKPIPEGSPPSTPKDYEAIEWHRVGTQVGFNPKVLGKLWNGLAKLALHIEIPTSKDMIVKQYGDIQAITSKVSEALAEIKRISEGTLVSSGVGDEVSFECSCGSKNKRRLELLRDEQIINCINPNCDESYDYVQSDNSFRRRTVEIACRACGETCDIPKRKVEKLGTDEYIQFDCKRCGETITVLWRLVQTQRTGPSPDFRIGDEHPKVLLVGACPGCAEEAQKRPFCGDSGENLTIMLQRLHELNPDIFPSPRRDDYSLINAHSLPRYQGRDGYDGRTEPEEDEVLAEDNKARLATQVNLVSPTTIVYLGKTAEYAHQIIRDMLGDVQFYRAGHPSTLAWNTRPDYNGMEKEEKLSRWAIDTFERIS